MTTIIIVWACCSIYLGIELGMSFYQIKKAWKDPKYAEVIFFIKNLYVSLCDSPSFKKIIKGVFNPYTAVVLSLILIAISPLVSLLYLPNRAKLALRVSTKLDKESVKEMEAIKEAQTQRDTFMKTEGVPNEDTIRPIFINPDKENEAE